MLAPLPLRAIHRLQNSTYPAFDYFMVAFILAFVAAGCIPAAFGLWLMFGQCRVMWRDGRLSVSDSVGPFGWRRRMPRAAIRRFTIRGGASSDPRTITAGSVVGMAAGIGALVAEFEKGKPRTIAGGYPREWLEAIATDLSGRAGVSQSAPPLVEATDATGNPPQTGAVLEKPADSKVVIQRGSASIVLEVPAAGLRKGSMGLFPLASAWCLFMAVFTFALAFGKRNPAHESGPLWPIFGLFWAVGLAMVAAAVNLGRRRATLKAGNSGLTVAQAGPFGVQQRDFRRGDIAMVCAGPSNFTVNHSRLLELQIHRVSGKKVGLFVGRDAGELRWMAKELTNALGMAAKTEQSTTH
jgi:hypothetical protein